MKYLEIINGFVNLSNNVNLEVRIEMEEETEMYYCRLIADGKIIPLSPFLDENEATRFQFNFWKKLKEVIFDGQKTSARLSDLVDYATLQK
jgi:hypothetical protein